MQITGYPELLFPSKYILSDRGIRKGIQQGKIRISDFEDRQIQPASFDIRIGKVLVYDKEAMAKGAAELNQLTIEGRLDFEPSQKNAKVYPDEADTPIILPSGCFAEIYFHEKIESDYMMHIDLRSSMGRLGLQPHCAIFPSDFVSLWNWNPNNIKLYGRTPFAQAFFHSENMIEGYIVSEPDEAARLAERLGLRTFGPYVLFELGDHAFRFRKIGLIDTRSPAEGACEKSSTGGLEVNINETIVVQLEPKVKLPADIGIRIIHEIPYTHPEGMYPNIDFAFTEPHCVNAGWVDPGYEGNITAHLRRTKMPRRFNKGDPIALGLFFRYDEPVLRPYGSKGLRSHYQNSEGETSRT